MGYYYFFKESVFHFTWAALLFPVLIICMALLGLGVGMIITSLTAKYRDLAFLVTFGVQLLMYATTVIYPLSTTPERYRWLIELNPMTPLIETFRFGFLGRGSFTWESLCYSIIVSILLLLIGIIAFNKVEKDFVDTV
jgi:lipopolysaccharide transport system permease protein